MRPHFPGLAAALVVSFCGATAHAIDTEVTSDTAAQFYDVRSPTGETILMRRRLTTTLGVGAYDLLDRAQTPGKDRLLGPELSFRARLRYDADYGASPEETNVDNYDRLVPGFSRGPVDLMYGYLEGRRFAGGWLGFKVGRQYVTDVLGWWSFDGGEVKVTTPYFVAAEVYGGLEVRGGVPLSSPRFSADGVWRGSRSGYDPLLYPSFQPATVAPAFGAALESTGVSWIHGRLTYRRVYNTGSSTTSQFQPGLYNPTSYDGMRISQERLGYAFDASLATIGGVKGGIAYDLYLARITSVYGSIDGYVGQKLTLSFDYDYFRPSFDGDSIWNFFIAEPTNDFGLRANYDVTDKLSVAGGVHARMFKTQTEPYYTNASQNTATGPDTTTVTSTVNYFPSNGVSFDEGGHLAARYRWGEGLVGFRGNGNFGPAGRRVGADVYGERVFETRYVAAGRMGLWEWDDKLRPDRGATSFQYVATLGYRFAPRSQASIEWEHNMNQLVGHLFLLILWLNVAVMR